MQIKLSFLRGHVRTKALLAFTSIIAIVLLLILRTTREDLHAAGQAAPSPIPSDGVSPIVNGLFDPIQFCSDFPVSTAETAELVDSFTASAAAARQVKGQSNAVWLRLEIENAQADFLEDFLVRYPDSAWAPSLHANLAERYHFLGNYTPALRHWMAAWQMVGSADSGTGKLIADRVLAKWTRLLASLGRVEELTEIIQQTQGRVLDRGAFSHMFARTKEAYTQLVHSPGISYKCGTFALASASHAVWGHEFSPKALLEIPSPASGFSVQMLTDISRDLNLGFQPYFREAGSEIPVPSVVHWSLNHYAAIVSYSDGRYKIVDPTFGSVRFITAETINQEASGVFLVHPNFLPAGFRQLARAEAEQIYGRGNANFIGDSDDEPCPGCYCPPGRGPGPGFGGGPGGGGPGGGGPGGGGPGGGGPGGVRPPGWETTCTTCPGMVRWRVSEPYLNLWLEDEPFTYYSAKGPPVTIHLSFKQRDETGYSDYWTSFGSTWKMAGFGYFQVYYFNTDGSPVSATINTGAGGSRAYSFDNGWATNYYDNTRITYVVQSQETTELQRHFPDGTVEHYSFRQENTWGSANKFFIKKIVHPDGTETTYNYETYDPQTMIVKLDEIVAPDGAQIDFQYVTDTTFVSKIVGPASEEVTFSYDSYNALETITDTEGIVSTISLDANGWPDSLQTPYGTTQFECIDSSNYDY